MTTYKRVSGDYVIETLGATDIVNINSTTTVITGDLSVSGNATLLGNISGDRLFNGTSNVEIASAGSNVTIGVGGNGVATFTQTGANINGYVNATGNLTTSNVNTSGLVTATGNVTAGNVITSGNIYITRDAATVANPTIRFTDSNVTVADGTVLGAVEWYTSDLTPGARVTSAIKSTSAGTQGNADVGIFTSTGGAAATQKFVVLSTGNVGIANAAPVDTLAVTGTAYISGNVTGANIITSGAVSAAGNVSATGNVISGNLITSGLASVTGNITGGNIISLGAISAGAGGVSATGNITGGNLNSNGILSVTSNIIGGNVVSATTLSASGNLIGSAIVASTANISGNMFGTGIGVENIVWQSTDTVISSASLANIGILQFNALANQAYKFEAFLPIVPDNASTTAFSINFSAGTGRYLVEAQTSGQAAFSAASSSVSDDTSVTQSMLDTTLRTVRITGTFTHTGNVTVALRGQTSVANLTVKAGATLSYTRIG